MPEALTPTLIARTGVVAEPRWAPDGRRLGWVRAVPDLGAGGRADVVVAGAPGASDRAPVVVTAETGVASTRSTGGGVWCWVGSEHVAVVDPDGRLVLVPVDGGPPRVLSRDGRAAAPAASADGDHLAIVVEHDDACDVAIVDLRAESEGESWPRRVSNSDYAWDPAWSPDGTRLAWHEWDLAAMSWDSSRIVVADEAGETSVVAGGHGVSVGQPRFSPAGDRLAWVSDADGWWNVVVADRDGRDARPVGPEPFEQAEPAWGIGQRSFAWSPDGTEIALSRNEEGFGRLVVAHSDGTGEVRDLARGWHHGLDWGVGGIVAVRSGARTPPNVCITAVTSGGSEREIVADAAPAGISRDALVEPEPVTWAADDGVTVFGLLFRPLESSRPSTDTDGPPMVPPPKVRPPMVLDVHGGPTGQATAQWKPFHQHLLTRGFAVLAPDPRGSTGHGRAYAQALAGGWGELDVDDCAAGVRAVVARGWCDPGRVVASGGSSGGLVALLLALQHPELVRAVVTSYPVTDLHALATTTHRFESRYSDWLVGELPDAAARSRERSPITHAAELRVPVLVLHGDADVVVPPAQVEAFVDAVRAGGGTVEHHVYAGEGHGWSSESTIRDSYARIDDFLRRHAA